MSLKGYKAFVNKHLSVKGLGLAAVGLALPALALAGASRLNLAGHLAKVPIVNNIVANPYGSAAVASLLTAGIAYAAYSMSYVSMNEAVGMNSIAIALMMTAAAKTAGHLPASVGQYIPDMPVSSSLAGYSGYNGYLGYLGDDGAAAVEEYNPASDMFGIQSSSVNVF